MSREVLERRLPMWKRLQSHRSRGQDLVEYALILPVLLLLLLGIMEFGYAVMSYDSISNAAREGARYGIIRPGDTSGVEAAARRLTTGLNQTTLQVAQSFPGPNLIRVQVTYDHTLITGVIIGAVGGNPTLHLSAAATMMIE
jgi:hypothetical protein